MSIVCSLLAILAILGIITVVSLSGCWLVTYLGNSLLPDIFIHAGRSWEALLQIMTSITWNAVCWYVSLLCSFLWLVRAVHVKSFIQPW